MSGNLPAGPDPGENVACPDCWAYDCQCKPCPACDEHPRDCKCFANDIPCAVAVPDEEC